MFRPFKLGALLALTAISLLCRPASACGGTFCDGGPLATPVDQTGENILFVMDGDRVEAHIQIQYQGDPMRFAWVLPIPAVPDSIEIGSQPLFQNLLNSTVPAYGVSGCLTPLEGGGGIALDPSSPGEVEILSKETVGSFEVTVLRAGTVAEVTQWLTDNGYEEVAEAPAILDHYVRQQFVFAATKLVAGAGLDEIHPLVVRYAGSAPCVPLELTAVHAVENMRVRAFVLANDRAVPFGYMHVTLNPLKLDWLNFADNYVDVVSEAVDSPLAAGHAFVTEYAGPSSVVGQTGIYSTSWNAEAFTALEPLEVVAELTTQGLLTCAAGSCTYQHPLILPLLRKYVPAPAGVDEQAFYSCLPCYSDLIDRKAWDGVAFGRELLERIVVPGRKAKEALDGLPYLTRLFTTISPQEMTLDPTFGVVSGLDPVDLTQQIACNFSDAVSLPDGRNVDLDDGSWPGFSDMPAAEKIEEFSENGEVIVLADNRADIDAALADWNGSGASSGLGRGGTGASGGTRAIGAAGTVGPLGANSDAKAEGGCGCRTPTRSAPGDAALVLAGAALAARIGRRRRNAR